MDTGLVRISNRPFHSSYCRRSTDNYRLCDYGLDIGSPKPDDLFESKEEDEFWKDVRTKPKATIRDVRHKFREIERRLRSAEAHVTSKEYNLKREFRDLEK